MGFALRPGLSFCLIGDRAVFLDVPHDRYFCLSRDVERIFGRLVAGEKLGLADEERLQATTLLVPVAGIVGPTPCPALANTGESLLDAPGDATHALEIGQAFASLITTRFILKTKSFAGLLRAFSHSKARHKSVADKKRAVAIARAFARTGYLLTVRDQCLLRSVAIARRFAATGLACDLVIGVKLEPFKAHCWAQQTGTIVNDRWDVIREFTPILIL